MEKKEYKTPTTKVVQLQQRCQILAGSGLGAMRSGYGTANIDDGTELTWE